MGFMTLDMSHRAELTFARKEGEAIDVAIGEERGMARGEIIGEERGEARNNTLIAKLLKQERFEDLERCTKDEDFRQSLYKEFNL